MKAGGYEVILWRLHMADYEDFVYDFIVWMSWRTLTREKASSWLSHKSVTCTFRKRGLYFAKEACVYFFTRRRLWVDDLINVSNMRVSQKRPIFRKRGVYFSKEACVYIFYAQETLSSLSDKCVKYEGFTKEAYILQMKIMFRKRSL